MLAIALLILLGMTLTPVDGSSSQLRYEHCLNVTGFEKLACLYPFELPDCNHADTAPGITVVSALYDLKREHWPHFKRHFNVYMYYTVQLMRLNVPLVIFVDRKVYEFIHWYRRGKENITRIIVKPIQELEYYVYLDSISNVMISESFKLDNALLKHPEGFSPEYNVLMSNKLSFIEEAISSDYFGSNYFVWLDAGYAHGKDVYPKNCNWAPRKLIEDKHAMDKVTYIEIENTKIVKDIRDIYKKHLSPFINGGYFSGDAKALKRYAKIYKEVFLEFLEEGMTDDDQTIAVAAVLKRPKLFNLVSGSWYDAFEMFT